MKEKIMTSLANAKTNNASEVVETSVPVAASMDVAEPVQAKAEASKIELPVLKIGVAGEAVRFLQQRLLAYGYHIQFTGQFGPQIDEAVKDFQYRYGGLLIDGVVGVQTWRALCGYGFPLGRFFYAPHIPTRYAYDIHMPALWEGDLGEAVECLQLRLQSLGYRIIADGIFGAKTRAAVENLQDRSGLEVDGIVGRDTWRKLGQETL
jgi:peptidoglycan hydrolase-like protein with peptidoglycan-binding domain